LDARDGRADAGVFADVAVVVKRDVEVGADKDALSLGFSLGAQVGEAGDVHGAEILVFLILGGGDGLSWD
jgi:hypothetical protein